MLEKEEPTDPEGNSHKGAAENAPLGTQVTSALSAYILLSSQVALECKIQGRG